MRRLSSIVLTLTALMLAGCYTEESPAPTANSTEQTVPMAADGAQPASGQGARPAGSTLGAAKRTAQSTVDRVQDQSANLAKEIEDPE